MMTIRIGTRGSALALAQADQVKKALLRAAPHISFEIVTMKTAGDILEDTPLDLIGGKGVFVKDIELALMEGRIDMAVHSLKDMQALLPEGLMIGACLKRADPRDMLFSRGAYGLEDLPRGSTVGTSSLRRRCQIKALRPDIAVVDIRGNVPTRLNKVGTVVDAVMLAAAGVSRLEMSPGVALDADVVIPSPGQGIIAVECRAEDAQALHLAGMLNHAETSLCARAERSFLAALGKDCRLPAGAIAIYRNGGISMTGMLGPMDCSMCERASIRGAEPSAGAELARMLMERLHGRAHADG
jgi:hydroxymethylbilane synthase